MLLLNNLELTIATKTKGQILVFAGRDFENFFDLLFYF